MDTPGAIREALKRDPRKRQEIADLAGIGRIHLSQFQNGHTSLSAEVQDRLAAALGVKIVVRRSKTKRGGK